MARYNHTAGFYYAWDMKVTRLTSDAADNILGIGKNLIPNSEFGAINGTYAPWANTWNPATGVFDIANRRIGIAGGAEKIGFGILEDDMGLADQLDEKILKEVVGVGFGTAQAEEETIERRCMGIVEGGDGIGGHARKELGDGEEQVSTG